LGRALAKGDAVDKVKVVSAPNCMGLLWVGGWLFTIGFLHLVFWNGVLAIVLWPYYLGTTFSALTH